ncbi:MAG TPA: BON domain-containing protein [Chthonomonadaceae bacterium]|nr:BON domain-containing protein [Chthonomonadaceae bacterium]
MTTTVINDVQIRDRVLEEMAYDPAVTANDIAVIVYDGVVTLDGIADSYGTRRAVELAAWRVYGVRNVIDNVKVAPHLLGEPTDEQIAADLRQRLEKDFLVPKGRISVSVEDGIAELRGTVRFHIQREAAMEEAEDTKGVRYVANLIEIDRSSPSPTHIASDIEKALVRNAQTDASNIKVTTDGGHVTLTGTTRSAAERESAIKTAWRASGVTDVTNNITIQPF